MTGVQTCALPIWWQAGFAKTIENGIKKLTGKEVGTGIDFSRVEAKKGGSFDEIFSEKKITLSIRKQGPFEIEIVELENVIPSVRNIAAYLVMKILFKDQRVPYAGSLYIGDDGKLYNCRYWPVKGVCIGNMPLPLFSSISPGPMKPRLIFLAKKVIFSKIRRMWHVWAVVNVKAHM